MRSEKWAMGFTTIYKPFNIRASFSNGTDWYYRYVKNIATKYYIAAPEAICISIPTGWYIRICWGHLSLSAEQASHNWGDAKLLIYDKCHLEGKCALWEISSWKKNYQNSIIKSKGKLIHLDETYDLRLYSYFECTHIIIIIFFWIF